LTSLGVLLKDSTETLDRCDGQHTSAVDVAFVLSTYSKCVVLDFSVFISRIKSHVNSKTFKGSGSQGAPP
jgi:hypothetical protein